MAKTDLVLGIDVGTSTTKVVLADPYGLVFLQKSASYELSSPLPGYAEQDPADWWGAVCSLTQELFKEHAEMRERIAAVGVSGQGAGAVVIDGSGDILRPAILSLDRRSALDAEHLQSSCGSRVVEISGKLPASYNLELKLRWIKNYEPDIWARTWKVLTATSFITYRLTGNPVMNHSDGGISLAYDLSGRQWSSELLSLMELPRSVYCELAECDAIIGQITELAAQATGIPKGVPVVAGGEDTSSAGLAMGVFAPGTGQLSLGTSNTVFLHVNFPITHAKLLAFPHVLPNRTLIGGSMSSGGLAVQWIAGIVSGGSSQADSLNQATHEAAKLPAGTEGLIFLPYLAGELHPLNDGFARGVFFGLNAEMGRAHLFRAVLEANALAIEHNLSVARTVGAAAQTLIAVGGPTRNALLCQIIADVTGLTLQVMNEHAGAALGSAILAAQGVNLSSLESMQAAHAKPGKLYSPSAERHSLYQKVFTTYTALYPRLKDLFPACSAIVAEAEAFPHVHV
ncbi:MAG: FGGY family carbohydrate kinase [Acidobacteriaceae bacterium]